MRPRSTRSPSAAEYHLSRAQYTQAAVGRRASEVGRRVGACGVRFVYNPLFTRHKSPLDWRGAWSGFGGIFLH
jgi:hypothetical protein